MAAQPVINRIVDLYDVDTSALADGKALVRQGTGWVAVDIATQTELDAAKTAAAGAAAGLSLVLGGI